MILFTVIFLMNDKIYKPPGVLLEYLYEAYLCPPGNVKHLYQYAHPDTC